MDALGIKTIKTSALIRQSKRLFRLKFDLKMAPFKER